MESQLQKNRMLELLKANIGKQVGVYYAILTEQGNFFESQYGIVKSVDDEYITIESLGIVTLHIKHLFIYKVVTRA